VDSPGVRVEFPKRGIREGAARRACRLQSALADGPPVGAKSRHRIKCCRPRRSTRGNRDKRCSRHDGRSLASIVICGMTRLRQRRSMDIPMFGRVEAENTSFERGFSKATGKSVNRGLKLSAAERRNQQDSESRDVLHHRKPGSFETRLLARTLSYVIPQGCRCRKRLVPVARSPRRC